jgi:pyrroline-5-carboxylate reductase
MKLAIMGGGNMGMAYAGCFLQGGVVGAGELLIIERAQGRREELSGRFRCRIESEPSSAMREAHVLLLAVKPQDMETACLACLPYVAAQQVIVSIMAGIPLSRLSRALAGHTALVRCMPNMPVQIGAGMTVYYPHPALAADECAAVEGLLRATGACLRLGSEDLIDAATAISGSGPGYIFYLLEHVMNVARDLGFSAEESELLVAETIVGAIKQWRGTARSAGELRSMVTSKGGTTAAALEVFDRGKVAESIVAGINRAYERAVELGGKG